MSITRDHNEWLSLLEISGPFLSMPVLLRVFPQGLDALDRDLSAELHLAYDEWVDNQSSLRPETAIHSVWVRYVLERLLGFEKTQVLEGPAIPAHLKATIAEQGEVLRPDLALSEGDGKVDLLVNIYPFGQGLDRVLHDHRWKASPATRMMELLRATGQPLGLVTNGEQWMLVHAPKGETTTFVSWYAALWFEEPVTLRAFTSLLGARRFFGVADEDTLAGMLKASADNQQEVTDQLGYQVRRAVEVLTRALDKADQDRGRKLLQGITESDLYEAALTVMMRLVFLFSAEERGLLLLGEPIYDQNYAVSTLRAQLREIADQQGEEVLERRFDAWCRLTATFRAVYGGIQHDRLNLPAYGGSLFDPDKYPFLEGRLAGNGGAAEPLPINNRTVLHLLESLQMLQVKVPGGGPAEPRRLSFRSLDVEQIGHVYEGLLDHIAVRANETVLGLSGTRDKEPEIGLSELEHERKKGAGALVKFLREQTGRSESALKKAQEAAPDAFAAARLKIACNNDEAVYAVVLPYAGLLRADDFGYPTVFGTGSVYITAGATRRATGTHYTPRSLTEPIVQHTLEPLVYEGPAEGWPKEKWQLRSPAAILDLKVCDMAMGSAGFLVQVIRYLSERLVEAWEATTGGTMLKITPEGKPASGAPGETIIPNDDEERLVLARRLVADRCIYGVDKNPLAVEIAKLSIWLTTMDKGRPFTFLDHALKCGDSLVGATEDEFLRWAHGWRAPAATLFDEELRKMIEIARQKRRELESFQVLELRDAERKAELLYEANAAIEQVKQGCDLLVGSRFLGLSEKEVEELQLKTLLSFMAGEGGTIETSFASLTAVKKIWSFHWFIEFPEVFEGGGFNAFLGNPPFLGGKRISTEYGQQYHDYIKKMLTDQPGSADLCAYFILRAFSLITTKGTLGFITTNTIAQGDTREVGLDQIMSGRHKGIIFYAIPSMVWPGTAAVFVAILVMIRGNWEGGYFLDGKEVNFISSFLDNSIAIGQPMTLKANDDLSHMGSNVFGTGFRIEKSEAQRIIERDSRYGDVLFPFLNGIDINTDINQIPPKWVINFHDWPLEVAQSYPECFTIVKNLVYPLRSKSNRKPYREKWWQFAERQTSLYDAIEGLDKCLVIALTSDTLAFAFVSAKGVVYSNATIVLAFNDYYHFAILQSSIHIEWARKYGSTMKGDARYTPTDVFQTYPFPRANDMQISAVNQLGNSYYEYRQSLMDYYQEGLTAIYNRFNNPEEKSPRILELREVHREMDIAIIHLYGWNNLNLDHGLYNTSKGMRFTICEQARREVLMRLLRLNHERYDEEVRQGMHDKGTKGKEKPVNTKNKGRVVQEDPNQFKLF